MSTLSPSGGPSGSGSRGRTIALVAVMAVLLFGAGVALSWFLRGGSGSSPQAGDQSPPLPCTTTTTKPSVSLPKPGQVSVNVYNSTDRTGLAAATAKELKGRGFTIGTIANDPLGQTIPGTAQIRYGTKGEANATLLKYYIAGATLVTDERKDASVDVVLGQTFKRVRPQAAVDAAIDKPVVTETGPGCTPTTPSTTTDPSPSTS